MELTQSEDTRNKEEAESTEAAAEASPPPPEKWYTPLTKVTPLSKTLAAILFIVLPIIGFWKGYQYQQSRAIEDCPIEGCRTTLANYVTYDECITGGGLYEIDQIKHDSYLGIIKNTPSSATIGVISDVSVPAVCQQYCTADDQCCMASVQAINEKHFAPLIGDDAQCPDDTAPNKMRCATSLTWCEPSATTTNVSDGGSCSPLFAVESGPELTASEDYAGRCYAAQTQSQCESVDVYDASANSFAKGDGKSDCEWVEQNALDSTGNTFISDQKMYSDPDYSFSFEYPSYFTVKTIDDLSEERQEKKLLMIPDEEEATRIWISVYGNNDGLSVQDWMESTFSDYGDDKVESVVVVDGVTSLRVESTIMGTVNVRTFVPINDTVVAIATSFSYTYTDQFPERYTEILNSFKVLRDGIREDGFHTDMWKTYFNKVGHYSFEYPSNWSYDESGTDASSLQFFDSEKIIGTGTVIDNNLEDSDLGAYIHVRDNRGEELFIIYRPFENGDPKPCVYPSTEGDFFVGQQVIYEGVPVLKYNGFDMSFTTLVICDSPNDFISIIR